MKITLRPPSVPTMVASALLSSSQKSTVCDVEMRLLSMAWRAWAEVPLPGAPGVGTGAAPAPPCPLPPMEREIEPDETEMSDPPWRRPAR